MGLLHERNETSIKITTQKKDIEIMDGIKLEIPHFPS